MRGSRLARGLLLGGLFAGGVALGGLATCAARADEPGRARAEQARDHAHDAFSDGAANFARLREAMLQEHVDGALSSDALWRDAAAGMLSGDGARPWDKLLSPSEYAELKDDLAGEVVGIGIEIRADDGLITVTRVVPGSSAAAADVRVGDKLLRLDGRTFAGLRERDVVRALRGPVGAPVKLTILRDAGVITKSVKRARLVFAPVTALALGDGIGLIQVRSFNDKTPALLRAAIGRLHTPSLHGLVIDLRNDAGGLFDSMMSCAALLLPRHRVVVISVERGREESLRTSDDPMVSGLPLVVLINGNTASSAEMLAGALRAGVGARLVGKHSFGKWSGQKMVELPNGWAARFTVALFKLPNGQLPDGKGIDPDIEVEMEPTAVSKAQALADPAARLATDAQLRAAVGLLKR